jgi:hypothetical protein
MFVIILNSSNVDTTNGNNNTLIYEFPNSISLKDKYIAVSQIVMYYSWFNISSVYQNNTFSYTWTNGATTTTYQVVIPDGLYNLVDMNNYLQWTMINNGHYLINSAGEFVYYAELLINKNRYAIQINTYLVPTSLPPGFTQPSNFGGYPTSAQNPVITIPANFNILIGYTAGFSTNPNVNDLYIPPTASQSNNYVSKNLTTGTLSYLSNTDPNIQPNSSIYLSISNINNPYSQPSSILYAITPNVAIGEQIVEIPPNFMWCKMIDGTYNQLRVQLLGIDKAPIQIKDKNMTITLTIKDKNEMI